MDEQKLNKKLAEWAGFYQLAIFIPADKIDWWLEPEEWYGKRAYCPKGKLPNFTQSLDACFKWLVPKVHAYVLQSFSSGHHLHHASVTLPYTNLQDMQVFSANVVRTENPALALCLAIEKLMEDN